MSKLIHDDDDFVEFDSKDFKTDANTQREAQDEMDNAWESTYDTRPTNSAFHQQIRESIAQYASENKGQQ
uniref:Stability determinant n=2 Tax=Bursaphelenchus xylophilus TaxID=6326 RepID=A0A1I7RW24_BURXY